MTATLWQVTAALQLAQSNADSTAAMLFRAIVLQLAGTGVRLLTRHAMTGMSLILMDVVLTVR